MPTLAGGYGFGGGGGKQLWVRSDADPAEVEAVGVEGGARVGLDWAYQAAGLWKLSRAVISEEMKDGGWEDEDQAVSLAASSTALRSAGEIQNRASV